MLITQAVSSEASLLSLTHDRQDARLTFALKAFFSEDADEGEELGDLL